MFLTQLAAQFFNLALNFSTAWADLVTNPTTTPQATSATGTAAQAAGAVAAQAPPAWTQFVPFLVIVVVFYFFLIRPQAKRQKETQGFLDGLRVGDQVVTQSGILGRVTQLTDQIVTLEVAHNVQIKVLKKLVLMSQAALTPKKEGK